MTKQDKLIQAVKQGTRISTEEAEKLLRMVGFEPRKQKSGTRHMTYSNGKRIQTILLGYKELPNYIIDQLQEILRDEGF